MLLGTLGLSSDRGVDLQLVSLAAAPLSLSWNKFGGHEVGGASVATPADFLFAQVVALVREMFWFGSQCWLVSRSLVSAMQIVFLVLIDAWVGMFLGRCPKCINLARGSAIAALDPFLGGMGLGPSGSALGGG